MLPAHKYATGTTVAFNKNLICFTRMCICVYVHAVNRMHWLVGCIAWMRVAVERATEYLICVHFEEQFEEVRQVQQLPRPAVVERAEHESQGTHVEEEAGGVGRQTQVVEQQPAPHSPGFRLCLRNGPELESAVQHRLLQDK